LTFPAWREKPPEAAGGSCGGVSHALDRRVLIRPFLRRRIDPVDSTTGRHGLIFLNTSTPQQLNDSTTNSWIHDF
jgi:hypothetical protein